MVGDEGLHRREVNLLMDADRLSRQFGYQRGTTAGALVGTVIDHLIGRAADDPAVTLVTGLGSARLGLLPLLLAIRRGRLGGCARRLLRPLQPQHQLDQLFLAQSLKIAPAHEGRESAFHLRRKGVGNYQPGLPMTRGRCETMTHDYKRHGTTTLFAVLNVLDGTVIGQCMSRHRHQEFIRFLNQITRKTPPDLDLHLIVDNYATHKHPKVRAWLARHPRFHFHFTPTSASWLNAVEGFFAKLTSKRLKRGVFSGIVDLQAAINRFLAEANECPKPFVWTADPDGIIEKVRRGRGTLAVLG